jgi:outer membrane protein OmpA-like peptidoglycan-associated protein/tetratricopeptide (TPR) repeat protein
MKIKTMKQFLLLIISMYLIGCSPLDKYIRKAGKQTAKGDLEKARQYYLKAYAIDTNSYKANIGLGITLSEFMGKYEEALPYLEKAEKLSPKDTLEDMFYALGKTYHYHEQFDKALTNYYKMKRYDALEDDNKRYKLELEKQIEDCQYAKTHTEITNPKIYYVANVGSKINTTAPEYVPVITSTNDLIFTSKRKDDKKEKINSLDGKYFESMYTSKYENGSYSSPRRYTIPDLYLKSAFKKGHESIVSMSPDGKKLFVYRNSKLYETEMNQETNEPKKLSKKINLDYYQNHAYLTKDGKTLYFTSEEVKGGVGGNDIYKVTKKDDGTWGDPENLGTTINTALDEDSPFISEDGKTLYFSSNGHLGYGSYDIFKSTFENGDWTEPVNIGKPMNSVGHDIFYTNTVDNQSGYFASNRMGGKGDMDIYKINFNPSSRKECPNTESDWIHITSIDTDPHDFKQQYAFELNDAIKNKVLDYTWTVGEDTSIVKESVINYDFKTNGTYTIKLKVVSWCDTCIEPLVSCKQIVSEFKVHPKDSLPPKEIDVNSISGQLTKNQLIALGFDVTPIYFDLNKFAIRADAELILSKNLEILKKYPMLMVDLIGNTDARASDNYNNHLSKQRAVAVENYFLKNGIAKKRIIKIEAKGKTHLVNNCIDNTCDESLHQLNRRVEFIISK